MNEKNVAAAWREQTLNFLIKSMSYMLARYLLIGLCVNYKNYKIFKGGTL